jgi:DNA-binding IclR family transcriptional regulator
VSIAEANTAPRLVRPPEASKVPAVSRAAAVLRLLGQSSTSLGVHAIARETGLVPSFCLNVLRALVAENFVAFDPETKRYSLDAGVLTLGRQWLLRNPFNNLAQPVLDRLAQDFDVMSFGVQVQSLDHIIIVVLPQTTSSFQFAPHIGGRFAALVSATGRCIAAFCDYADEEIRHAFEQINWAKAPTYEDWLAQVEEVKLRGFGVDVGNHKAGMTFIAAPVWSGPGNFSHSLVVGGISSVLQERGEAEIGRAVLAAARRLSDQLCGRA